MSLSQRREEAHAQVWTPAWTPAERLARLQERDSILFESVIRLEKKGAAGVASLCVCPHTSARGWGWGVVGGGGTDPLVFMKTNNIPAAFNIPPPPLHHL